MTAEMKYTPRVLKLNTNSSLEERTTAFDEMAPFWEKVNKHGTPSGGTSVNFGWACAAMCLKPWPSFRPKLKKLHFVPGKIKNQE